MKRKSIYVQNNLFWEDEENQNATVEHLKTLFDVNVVDDQSVQLREVKIPMGALMRGSMMLAQSCGVTFRFARVEKWLPVFREFCFSETGIFVDMKYAEKLISQNGKYFLRPLSPFKEFAGQVFDSESIKKEIAWLKQGKNINAESLICLAAPPVNISKEWRCIFVNGEYISGSQYMENGTTSVKPEVPDNVIKFAKELGSHSYFTNIFDFVIDIGESGGELKMVEINGFETASFYAANLKNIYSAWANSL